MADLDGQQLLAAQTTAIMEKVQKLLDQLIPRFTPGTVEAYASGPGIATVNVDGDPAGQLTPMSSLVGLNLVPGQRVMVLFVPPHGAFVMGTIAGTGEAVQIPAGWSALNVTDTRIIDASTASPTTTREVLATLIQVLTASHILSP